MDVTVMAAEKGPGYTVPVPPWWTLDWNMLVPVTTCATDMPEKSAPAEKITL